MYTLVNWQKSIQIMQETVKWTCWITQSDPTKYLLVLLFPLLLFLLEVKLFEVIVSVCDVTLLTLLNCEQLFWIHVYYAGTKPLQTILVQMDTQTHWLSFKKKLTWSVLCDFLSLSYNVTTMTYSKSTVSLCSEEVYRKHYYLLISFLSLSLWFVF